MSGIGCFLPQQLIFGSTQIKRLISILDDDDDLRILSLVAGGVL